MTPLNTCHSAYQHFQKLLVNDVEEFWAVALNPQKRPIASQCLFRGSVDQCLIHPRDVFRFVCAQNSSSFLVAHNHPSGSHLPSIEDKRVTQNLMRLSRMMEIPLLDHIVLATDGFYSFRERRSYWTNPEITSFPTSLVRSVSLNPRTVERE